MFICKECGSLMAPKKKGGKNVMTCVSCGKSNDKVTGIIKEEVKHDGKEVEVVHNEIETDPVIETKCPKCGHDKAYFWEIQTRASDEPATKFYKCCECKHICRDYK